ncbi:MAG TPA: hypothetical protein PKE64_31255 [Anaerolineae bacterium]|nr:hypothetical protein [Anaerolineae bacterium]
MTVQLDILPMYTFNRQGRGVGLTFCPSSLLLASVDNNDVKIWRISDGEPRYTIKTGGYVNVIDYSPNGELIAVSNYHGAGVWNAQSFEQLFFTEGIYSDISIAYTPRV